MSGSSAQENSNPESSRLDKRRHAKYFGLCVGLLTAALLVCMAISSFMDYRRTVAGMPWPSVPVLGLEPQMGRYHQTKYQSGAYYYYVHYQYMVNNKMFSRWTAAQNFDDEASSKRACELCVNGLRHGGKVFYNPADPNDSAVAVGGSGEGPGLFLMWLYLFMLPFPLAVAFWAWRIKTTSAKQ
ncbi:MAG TPA: DUF3592 domain-containing protein [Oculatellaceae cyanobacterium]